MNREHQPCGTCSRFPPASRKDQDVERTGHCSGWDKQALSTDQPCVLFNDRDAWQTRKAELVASRDQFPRDCRAPAPARPARVTTTTTGAA